MAKQAINLAKKYGIETYASYILGNPSDTEDTIRSTIDFAKELNTDQVQFSIATPYPKTELWELAKAKNKITGKEDYTEYRWYYSVVGNVSTLPDELLIEFQHKAYEEYKNR